MKINLTLFLEEARNMWSDVMISIYSDPFGHFGQFVEMPGEDVTSEPNIVPVQNSYERVRGIAA